MKSSIKREETDLLPKPVDLIGSRYFYRLEKIIHRPESEDVINTLEEIKQKDLAASRKKATRLFQEQLKSLTGKYSPESYSDYNTKLGKGYNLCLLLVDKVAGEEYLVESSMAKIRKSVEEQKKTERKIFRNSGYEYPTG